MPFLWEKFRRKTKPKTKIVITPIVNRAASPKQQRQEMLGNDRVFTVTRNTDYPRPKGKLRRRSQTEPAISLSAYRKQKGNRLNGVISPQQHFQQRNRLSSSGNNTNNTTENSNLSSRLLNKVGTFTGEVESVIQAGTIGSIASFSGSQLFSTVLDDSGSVDTDIFNNFEFPIHNLAFEGGGNKGMAYVGVLQVILITDWL